MIVLSLTWLSSLCSQGIMTWSPYSQEMWFEGILAYGISENNYYNIRKNYAKI